MKKNQIISVFSLAMFFNYVPLNGCGFSHLPNLMSLLWLGAVICIVSIIIYIAYVYYSYKLFRDRKAQQVSTANTRTIAVVLATINTLVFLSAVSLVFESSFSLFVADLFAWGIPFYFFINGIKSRTDTNVGLNESQSVDS